MGALDELAGQPETPAFSALDALAAPPTAPAQTQITPMAPAGPGALDQIIAAPDSGLQEAADTESTLDKGRKAVIEYLIAPLGGPKVGGDFRRGVVEFLAYSTKSAGQGVKALHEALAPPEEHYKFEPTLKAPISSLLVMGADVVDDIYKKLYPEPIQTPEHWWESIPYAMGSTAGFLAGGEALKALGWGTGVSIAALGGASQSSQQYEEAIQMGADPNQALLAYAGGAVVGTSEALPGAWMLNRLNRLGGGRLLEKIKDVGLSGEPGLLSEAVKGFLLEGGQEAAQQLGSNWIASDLAGYDPSRTLGENFWQNFATGGVIGTLFGGTHAMVRRGEVNRALDSMRAARETALASGDPINWVDGSFSPVEQVVGLQAMYAKLEQDLLEKGQRELEQFPEGRPALDIIAGSKQEPLFGSYNAGVVPLLANPVDKDIEKALPKYSDGTPLPVSEALQHTPVVAMTVNPYASMRESVANSIKNKTIALGQAIHFEDKAKIEQYTKHLSVLQKTQAELDSKVAISKRVVGYLKDYAASFREAITPDLKIVVTDGSNAQYMKGPRGSRFSGSFAMANKIDIGGKPTDVGIIYANIDALVTSIYNDRGMNLSDETRKTKREIFEIMSHELGHAVAISNLFKWRDQALQGDVASLHMVGMMTAEYGRWLQAASGAEQTFLTDTMFAPEHGAPFVTSLKTQGLNQSPLGSPNSIMTKEKLDYFMSFDEFFAEMTARLAAQGQLQDPVMTEYFKPVLTQYQLMFEQMPQFAQSEFGNDWLKFLQSQTAKFKIREAIEAAAAGGGKGIVDALRGNVPGFDPENFAGLQEHLDRFDTFRRYGLNILQLQRENAHIGGLQNYVNALVQWAAYQRSLWADAVSTEKAWRSLGKAEASALTDVLFTEAEDQLAMHPNELAQRLSPEALQVYAQVREQLGKMLEEMRKVSLEDAQKSFRGNEEKLKAQVEEINKEFDRLKSSAYFPYIRFGKYTITARAKEDLSYNGKVIKKGSCGRS